jgi:Tfp pilus assembly protein PilF
LCEQVVDQMGTRPMAPVLLASCYAHERRWDAARRNIEKVLAQDPKNPLVQAWSAHILRGSGEPDRASVVLGSAAQNNRRGEYALPFILQGRFFNEVKDVEGAGQVWRHLYERGQQGLPIVTGLAQMHADRGSLNEAQSLLEQGLRMSPNYAPLLVLRKALTERIRP